ncbi:MAG TPA: hypothetical protein VKE94_23120 [Gemmataceae bacterium]|nr:hypothetical protein [Gemmataceae bacterium]
MHLTTSAMELNAALKTLRLLWEETRAGWSDAVSRDFESNHWETLETRVVAALRAMDRLAPILMQAKRDCS